ncbi:MAG: hypothetical protein M0R68_12865 [Bacteroidetes bacterium]|nr:hypothetical protein [Bacteroidota bacterium]
MIEFFLIDVFILLFSLAALAVFKSHYILNRLTHGSIIAAMTAGLVFTVQAYVNAIPLDVALFHHPGLGAISLHVDTLSLFFLGLIQIGGIIVSVNGIGTLSMYENLRPIKPTLIATVLLFFSMQLVVVAYHAFLFLVAWEMMALAGYLGIILEREKEEVQKGSLVFFVATHVGTLFLYIMFLLLHWQTQSWEFSKFTLQSNLPSLISTVFWTGFIGFGMKAGFMPFHFWKPETYPVAPTHLSAALSAIMPKTGIYGLIRVITWIHPVDYFIPSALLAISSGTAIMGIWNALTQKDFKRMLAYSSVENIGIIGMALSITMFGIMYQQPLVTFLGLAGTLFQTANHFVFKSLLFLSAGTIQHHFQHRNIERMGGLLKSAPIFGGIVLIGSLAISGLPPLNGFASEFLIFSSFFEASHSLKSYFPFFMLIAAVALAFVGGLAVVAFSKNYSMIFLGKAKATVPQSFHITVYEHVSLILLTAMIVGLGIFPEAIIGICTQIFAELFPSRQLVHWGSSAATIRHVGMVAIAVVLIVSLLMIWKSKLATLHSTRVSAPWGCGYAAQTVRMQYSGTSFSDMMVHIAGKALTAEKEFVLPGNTFPAASSFQTNVKDFVLHKIILPVSNTLQWVTEQFKWLQSSQIQIYISFSIVVLVFYLYLAFYF